MTALLERQMHAMAVHAREVLSPHVTDTCCVAATRVGLTVLEELGVRARPHLVAMAAFNAPFAAGLRAPPAAIISTDVRTQRPGFLAGHLVIVGKVAGRRFLLDLSAYQADRPERAIHVPTGICVVVGPSFVERRGWKLDVALYEGGHCVYCEHPHPFRMPWKESPNWTLPTREHREAYDAMVRGFRECAAAAQ